MRKSPVFWTYKEKKALAAEVIRLETADPKMKAGSILIRAQSILPEIRRRSAYSFRNDFWLQNEKRLILAKLARNEKAYTFLDGTPLPHIKEANPQNPLDFTTADAPDNRAKIKLDHIDHIQQGPLLDLFIDRFITKLLERLTLQKPINTSVSLHQ